MCVLRCLKIVVKIVVLKRKRNTESIFLVCCNYENVIIIKKIIMTLVQNPQSGSSPVH